MPLVVADTGPINYLLLIGHIEILPQLFERVFMPKAVHDELTDIEAPSSVREWVTSLPAWIEVRPVPTGDLSDPLLRRLGEGERAAITLSRFMPGWTSAHR